MAKKKLICDILWLFREICKLQLCCLSVCLLPYLVDIGSSFLKYRLYSFTIYVEKTRAGQNRPNPFETVRPKPKRHIRVGFHGPTGWSFVNRGYYGCKRVDCGLMVWTRLKPNPNRTMHYHQPKFYSGPN
jgi:hypothetical protein